MKKKKFLKNMKSKKIGGRGMPHVLKEIPILWESLQVFRKLSWRKKRHLLIIHQKS